MDERTRNRLCENALAIEKFRCLDPKEKEWLLPLLNRGIHSTIEMLDLIAEEKKTFEEIAQILGLHPHTIAQKLNALAQGGMAIDLTSSAAYAPTGRPRKLAKKSD